MGDDLKRVRAELERWGLLLLQDPRLPSLATLIAGGPIKGSWWGHASGGDIFRVAGALEEETVAAKLIDGKVTFVHRRLWPALAAVGSAGEPWQVARLPVAAAELFAQVERRGEVDAAGPAAKELQRRLLCAAREVHTPSGAHATRLSTWARFARDARLGRLPSPAAARHQLEEAVAALPGATRPPRLPWR